MAWYGTVLYSTLSTLCSDSLFLEVSHEYERHPRVDSSSLSLVMTGRGKHSLACGFTTEQIDLTLHYSGLGDLTVEDVKTGFDAADVTY